MSKITFRADDDLVDRLEACDASKSEVMREALRSYLDEIGAGVDGRASVVESAGASDASDASNASVDDALAERVDELIADRLDAALDERLGSTGVGGPAAYTPGNAGEINVNVSLDAPNADSDATADAEDTVSVTRETSDDAESNTRKTQDVPGAQTRENACSGCGESVPANHVYCPNCGEKQSHRAFCECGDELRTDWAFCPGCGRRTPAADVLKDR